MMPLQWSTEKLTRVAIDPGNLKISQFVSGAVATDHVLLLNRLFFYFTVRSLSWSLDTQDP